jgi:hypothetical protein
VLVVRHDQRINSYLLDGGGCWSPPVMAGREKECEQKRDRSPDAVRWWSPRRTQASASNQLLLLEVVGMVVLLGWGW